MSAQILMNEAGRDQHNYRAHDRCQNDGEQLGLYQVKIEHQRHSRRNKEETEIGHEKVAQTFNPLRLHPAEPEKQREQQHSDDARRQSDSGQPDYQLAQSKTSEKDGALSYHFLSEFVCQMQSYKICPPLSPKRPRNVLLRTIKCATSIAGPPTLFQKEAFPQTSSVCRKASRYVIDQIRP